MVQPWNLPSSVVFVMLAFYAVCTIVLYLLITDTIHMAKNPITRTITVLELNNITLGIYTNNLAAYEALKAKLPEQTSDKLISYSTVNRAVQASGDSIDIPTITGIFVIRKCPLYRFHS
jgi:hypothetical protein